jgi:hypothetical protein
MIDPPLPKQTAWTEETCHYVVAIDGFRHALLAGPYRTTRKPRRYSKPPLTGQGM